MGGWPTLRALRQRKARTHRLAILALVRERGQATDGPVLEAGRKDADRARVAVRLSADYLLRSLHILAELGDGDLVTALVSMAIVQANVGHLDQTGGSGSDYADSGRLPPDHLRRPVSVLALAANLGLPYETTRRHVAKLLAAGSCLRVKGGVIVPTAALDTAWHREHVQRNLANLRRLFRGLKAAGVDLA